MTDTPGHRTSRSRLGMIWAQDVTGLLGADGGMLWRVPADFQHFRTSTMGCGVVMGRTTWESLGGALSGRLNVVLTRDASWQAEGAVRAGSLSEALALAAAHSRTPEPASDEHRSLTADLLPRTWVVGGGSVYDQVLAQGLADLLLVSTIDIDAAAIAVRQELPPESLVRAPHIRPQDWIHDATRSDPPATWRPVSGDARWRLDAYCAASTDTERSVASARSTHSPA